MQLSQRALSLQESAIRKLDLTVRQQRDVEFFRLNIGQPDIETPPEILDAIQAWRPRVIAYGPASGTPDCREAFARYHRRWQPALQAKDVAVTTGGSEALLFAFTAICDPGDEILVPAPYYTNYNGFATVAGARVRAIDTRIEDNFALPSDAELDAIKTEKTKAFVFSNPGNPTGAIYDAQELKRIAQWCMRNQVYLISDEVYRRIWFSSPPATALSLEEEKDVVIVIDSLSKTWSACGLRLGAFISRNPILMEKIERLGQARLGVQPLSQIAGIAALSLPDTYYDSVRLTWKKRVETLYNALNDIPNIQHNRPSGAFYTMVQLPVDSSESFARYLVCQFRDQKQSLVVAPGGGFYQNAEKGQKQIRLAAVLEESKLKRAAEILRKALIQYPGSTI
ncbi:MAG: pyridoxal phosphate-dependent aminotransferase [Myxococcota bacterium]|nr:pyridoxal phosphate-dependent aminotransferase [Myxococcota bacterium]